MFEAYNFATVVYGFVEAVISGVSVDAVFDSALAVASFDSAIIVVIAVPEASAVVFDFAMTALPSAALTDVVSDHGKDVVVCDQMKASSDFVMIVVSQPLANGASRVHCSSLKMSHLHPWKDA
jgi:hypothetical protein